MKTLLSGLYVLACSALAFLITDCSVGHSEAGVTSVVSKRYRPPETHVVTSVDSEGHTTIDIDETPPQWFIVVENGSNISVSQHIYNRVQLGQEVITKWRVGRWTKGRYLEHVVSLETSVEN